MNRYYFSPEDVLVAIWNVNCHHQLNVGFSLSLSIFLVLHISLPQQRRKRNISLEHLLSYHFCKLFTQFAHQKWVDGKILRTFSCVSKLFILRFIHVRYRWDSEVKLRNQYIETSFASDGWKIYSIEFICAHNISFLSLSYISI